MNLLSFGLNSNECLKFHDIVFACFLNPERNFLDTFSNIDIKILDQYTRQEKRTLPKAINYQADSNLPQFRSARIFFEEVVSKIHKETIEQFDNQKISLQNPSICDPIFIESNLSSAWAGPFKRTDPTKYADVRLITLQVTPKSLQSSKQRVSIEIELAAGFSSIEVLILNSNWYGTGEAYQKEPPFPLKFHHMEKSSSCSLL